MVFKLKKWKFSQLRPIRLKELRPKLISNIRYYILFCMTNFTQIEYRSIVIGTSAGGLDALGRVLSALPENYSLPLIIVAHRGPKAGSRLEDLLNSECAIHIKQAEDKEIIKSGTAFVAPPDYHLLIEDDKTLSLSADRPIKYSRPSIDVLFESAAFVFGEKLIGIILTGANDDGSLGLTEIRERGGLAIVQTAETAEADSMPKSAIKMADPQLILPLDKIGPFLLNLKKP